MQAVLIITDLPMDKELTRKAMAAVYGGNGTGSAAPSVPTTSSGNTAFTTSYSGTLPGYAISNPENVTHAFLPIFVSARDMDAVSGLQDFFHMMAGGD